PAKSVEAVVSTEPKVLSESAQLAQQISAAIAEHSQQNQAAPAITELPVESSAEVESTPAIETVNIDEPATPNAPTAPVSTEPQVLAIEPATTAESLS